MSCEHIWDFHAELADKSIVRWCSQCGGIQTYEIRRKKQDELSLKSDDGSSFKPIPGTESELMIPDVVEDDDGLYSEGVIRELQPEILFHRSNFKKEWTPDDSGEMNVHPMKTSLMEFDRCERTPQLDEMLTLAGVKKYNEDNCKGKY